MVGFIDLVQTLAAPHAIDRYLELVRPTLTLRDMRAEITHVRHTAVGSVTLTLRPTRQWVGYRAGQYVQIGVLIDGVKHTRCYSPVDAGGRDGSVRLTIAEHAHGLVSRYLSRHAVAGMVVDLAPAAGDFVLPESRPDRIVLISGGSGITPVLSMLYTLAAENYSGRLVFLHYGSAPEAVSHRAELAEIARHHPNFHIELRYPSCGVGERIPAVAPSSRSGDHAPNPDGGWSCAATARPVGYFDHDTIRQLAPWFTDAETFVCGPPTLMDAVGDVYRAEGLDDRLHTEKFVLSTVPVDAADVTGATTFSASGARADNTGASLLDQAESAGLTPDYGCRMGICFSCTAVRRSGCTRDLRSGELDADPDQPIQLCINAAVGDVDIEI